MYMWHKTAKVLALLDSGATENFIDKQTTMTLRLGTRALTQPLNIHNVDGTTNQEGQITQYCDLWVRKDERNTKLRFYITSLGRDQMILRHPWFQCFNPNVNWLTNSLKGSPVCIKTAGYQTKKHQQIRKQPRRLTQEYRHTTTDMLKFLTNKLHNAFTHNETRTILSPSNPMPRQH